MNAQLRGQMLTQDCLEWAQLVVKVAKVEQFMNEKDENKSYRGGRNPHAISNI